MSSDTTGVLVYTPCPDLETAKRIANSVVASRLAACANILPGMVSVYRWDGKIVDDREVVLILKTRSALELELLQQVALEHPYEVPAVFTIAMTNSHKPFMDWLKLETIGDSDGTEG